MNTEKNTDQIVRDKTLRQFVGRQDELARFDEFFQRQNFSAILLTGPTGIGKSSLLRYLSELEARKGHWVHYLSLDGFRGATELDSYIAESLSSGRRLIGKEINLWKELLQSNHAINDVLLPLLEYSSEPDSPNWLQNSLDLIAQQIPEAQRLVFIFDGIDAAENSEQIVQYFEKLLRVLSKNTKVRLIFSSRHLSMLDRLTRYHSLYRIELSGFSTDSIKEYLLRFMEPEIVPTGASFQSFVDKIADISGGSPLFVSLIVDQAKEFGLKNTTGFALSLYETIGLVFNAVTKGDENTIAVLKAIALLGGSASNETLKELLGVTTSDISKIIELAADYSFIRVAQDGTVSFAHESIRNYVITQYIFRNDFKPTLLDFGSEEAESDHRLETSFIFSNALDDIFSGQKNIILGDRGSGKSSIFRFISNIEKFPIPNVRKKKFKAFSKKLLIVPCDDPTTVIQSSNLFDDPNATPEKYKLFWLLYIALLSSIAIYKRGDYDNPENWKDLGDILKTAGFKDIVDGPDTSLFKPVLDSLTKIGSKVSFSIAGIPISLEPSAELKSEKSKATVDISKLLEVSNLITSNLGRHLIILIDKVDEIFKYEREKQERLIQGLFLAIAHLTKYPSLKVTVFLRTDIFQTYNIQEKNKFVSRSLQISWNQQDILRLLIRRLEANKILQGIRPFLHIDSNDSEAKIRVSLMTVFPEQVEGLPFIEWITRMMRNGKNNISPRQVILFLVVLKDILLNSPSIQKRVPIFNDTDVKQAITRLSELSYDEVITDFRVSPTLIQNCRAGKISEFTQEEVHNLFSEKEGSILSQLDLLEKLGIIERVVKLDVEKGFVSKFKFPDLYTRFWFY